MATVNSDIFKPTKFGGKYTATLIPGDGIGAEVTESVKAIFKADNVPIEWEQVDVSGMDTGDKHAEELFRESIASLKRNKLGLKGMDAPIHSSCNSSNERNVRLIDFFQKAFFTLPSSDLVTSLSTSPFVRNSTYTPP
jgi:isocitrate dehydrogenase (NAD+)